MAGWPAGRNPPPPLAGAAPGWGGIFHLRVSRPCYHAFSPPSFVLGGQSAPLATECWSEALWAPRGRPACRASLLCCRGASGNAPSTFMPHHQELGEETYGFVRRGHLSKIVLANCTYACARDTASHGDAVHDAWCLRVAWRYRWEGVSSFAWRGLPFRPRCMHLRLGPTHVAGYEARGFIFGPPIALALGIPFIMIRKAGEMQLGCNLVWGLCAIV